MIFPSTCRPLLVLIILMAMGTFRCEAEEGLGLISRPDWFGAPYLVTNPPGSALSPFQVCVVLNPALTTNAAYQAKVDALSATHMAAPPSRWAPFFQSPWFKAQKQATAAARPLAAPAAKSTAPGWPARLEQILPPELLLRWGLFVGVVLFLARRIWRYFHEVEDHDDFADRLATLAVAHRWVFPVYLALLASVAAAEYFQIGNILCSCSVLFLASSVRRYYCEGDFANFPSALTLHLSLRLGLIWLGWRLGLDGWWLWLRWAFLTWAFSAFLNGPDMAHSGRQLWQLLTVFGLTSAGGGLVGCALTAMAFGGSAMTGFVSGSILAALLLTILLFVSGNPVFMQAMGGIFVDQMLRPFFGQKVLKKRRLPEVLLLQHWRDRGDVDKAWQEARRHLLREERALPLWLFAMETAVLHRRRPGDATSLLGELCSGDAFHYNHRMVAVNKMQGWMDSAGFLFEPERFKVEQPPLQRTAVMDEVEQKCREGRFNEAAYLLRQILAKDSLNEPAFVQLVRIYAQDLKNRREAQNLIDGAADAFSPKLVEYLNRSLDEWIQKPMRSQLKPNKLFAWLPGKNTPEPRKKLFLVAPPIVRPAAPVKIQDPMERYLNRVKKAQSQPSMPRFVTDPVEKLLMERRLGTAAEMVKQKAEAAPEDFALWLRYAEVLGHHCGDVQAAQKVIERMERSGLFKKSEIKKAHTQLKKWRKHHTHPYNW